MNLTIRDAAGQRFLEGPPGNPLIHGISDVTGALEACFEHGINRLLLSSENLPERFFDLRSGEAGAILQRLRTYHIRLAVVVSPDFQAGSRFRELMVDEQRGPDFRLFDDAAMARAWLCQD